MKAGGPMHAMMLRAYNAKVQGPAPAPRAGPAESQAVRAPRDPGTFTVDDFVDLSPQAQLKFTEDMLLTEFGAKIHARFQEYGVELEDHAGEDQSSEAVADRIFRFTTGLFEVFRGQNADLNEDELVDTFESTIRGGVHKGYEEAVGLLSDTSDFTDEVRSLGARTMDTLSGKFDAFFADLRGATPGAVGDEVG